MVLYFSGTSGQRVDPEMSLGDEATIMLSFFDSQKKLQPRFRRVLKARRRGKKRKGVK